jgi:hypothetical protein
LILSEEEYIEAITRGAKEMFSGSKKECERYFDELQDEKEGGYTGPIWDKLDLNQFD